MSEARVNWSSRSVGAPWQHRFFYALIRFSDRYIAYPFLYPLVSYYLLLRPDQRRKTRYYLDRRFPGQAGPAAWLSSFRMIIGLARSLVDRARVGIRGPGVLAAEFPEHRELARLAAEEKGIIILTSHVGCWQAAMSWLAALKRPVHMLMRRDEGDIDRLYFEHSGEISPYRIIDPTAYLGGVLELVAALRRGEIVCLMGDRVFGKRENSLTVDFLGAPVAFPLAAWTLAAATGAPVAVLFPVKTGPDGYRIELARVIRVPARARRPFAKLRPYLERYVRALEELCRREPYQFFNFYDMWADTGSVARDPETRTREQGWEHAGNKPAGTAEEDNH